MLADSSEGSGSPLSTERLAAYGRNKEQRTDAVYGLQGRWQVTRHKAINCVCVDATAPLAARGAEGKRDPHIAW